MKARGTVLKARGTVLKARGTVLKARGTECDSCEKGDNSSAAEHSKKKRIRGILASAEERSCLKCVYTASSLERKQKISQRRRCERY